MPTQAFIQRASEVTGQLMALLTIPVSELQATADEEQVTVNITIPEEESGVIIGYHGETLAALQYLVGQLVNRGEEQWTRLVVNINSYRDQRSEQLRQMARNAADRAVATGDEIEMPFLTPAERRIIHLELAERNDVTSYSEGEARARRLIVSPKTKTETDQPAPSQ